MINYYNLLSNIHNRTLLAKNILIVIIYVRVQRVAGFKFFCWPKLSNTITLSYWYDMSRQHLKIIPLQLINALLVQSSYGISMCESITI